jgi:prepilin-type N-terminal cleavage/methylation domain-containing protein
MRDRRSTDGYTLIELIVALLLFTVGGLALSSTAALMGRELNVDGRRQHAARLALTRLEWLRAGCGVASSGREVISGIESRWSVSGPASRVSVTEHVTYATWEGERTDSYVAILPCP